MKFRKVLSCVLVVGMLLAIPAVNQEYVLNSWDGAEIFIASQSGRDNAKNELDNVKDKLEDLEDEYANVEIQLSEKAEVLSALLADKAILEQDIGDTQAAIDQTKLDLEKAKIKEQESYEAMTVRIQYMYENSTQDSVWDAVLTSKSITDLLNRVEYINQVHKTDRQMLEEYKALVQEIELLAADLEASMNDLLAMQEIYERQEVELANAMAELEAEAENFQEQIAAAEAEAKRLKEYIEEQNRLIALQQQQQNNGGGNSGNKKPATSGGYLTDPSYDPPFTSGVSGSELVNFAQQFVGNPYVWGGNSLTNGCDCSGFVNQVYKQFGFTLPRYSQAFKTVGQPVAFDNLKAGDIVVYPGHVAIYIGNGCIVEAQSSRTGITNYRSVTCNTITAIRRVL